MEQEIFLSGYCRQIDGSRTVTAVVEAGKLLEVDCKYGTCLYETTCPIGKAIAEKLKEM